MTGARWRVALENIGGTPVPVAELNIRYVKGPTARKIAEAIATDLGKRVLVFGPREKVPGMRVPNGPLWKIVTSVRAGMWKPSSTLVIAHYHGTKARAARMALAIANSIGKPVAVVKETRKVVRHRGAARKARASYSGRKEEARLRKKRKNARRTSAEVDAAAEARRQRRKARSPAAAKARVKKQQSKIETKGKRARLRTALKARADEQHRSECALAKAAGEMTRTKARARYMAAARRHQTKAAAHGRIAHKLESELPGADPFAPNPKKKRATRRASRARSSGRRRARSASGTSSTRRRRHK